MPTKTKLRNHNEFFRDVKRPKTCPSCGHTHTQVYSWGEYKRIKWHNVKQFCEHCFRDKVYAPLVLHAVDCGCSITLQWKGWDKDRPTWLPEGIEVCPIETVAKT